MPGTLRLVVISGLSGSGKSVALHMLADLGYFCVDNLDARSAHSLSELPEAISQLKAQGHHVDVIFLTAKTESLINRFSETRRSHPLSHRIAPDAPRAGALTLVECLQQEREMLSAIEGLGHQIDTSGLSANQLRAWIRELIHTDQQVPLSLLFESFAFKSGVPLDADLVFDVRCLPNPHYDPVLRPLTGRDAAVIAFLEAEPEAGRLLADIRRFVADWLPAYRRDNRSYLTVAIGCTGGRHRSVYFTETLARHFRDGGPVLVRHRQLAA